MSPSSKAIEQGLRREIDPGASVHPFTPALSPFLSGAYDLHEASLLGGRVVVACPREESASEHRLAKQACALDKALGESAVLYLSRLSRRQRRALVGKERGFITAEGDCFLPGFSLLFSKGGAAEVEVARDFTPAQQAVFLHCLYAEEGSITGASVQGALGISSGSASSALSALVGLGLLEYTTGGKTGRKKSYRVKDAGRYFDEGIGHFGSPVRETITAPLSVVEDGWLKAGLSALAEQSDLLAPEFPEYAISGEQATRIFDKPDEAESRCVAKVLKYDPRLFAVGGRVDPVTMLLTIDEDDERISSALRQALEGQRWYRG